MLELGEYATYKDFGLDLIKCLEHSGFSESIKEGEKAKSRNPHNTSRYNVDILWI